MSDPHCSVLGHCQTRFSRHQPEPRQPKAEGPVHSSKHRLKAHLWHSGGAYQRLVIDGQLFHSSLYVPKYATKFSGSSCIATESRVVRITLQKKCAVFIIINFKKYRVQLNLPIYSRGLHITLTPGGECEGVTFAYVCLPVCLHA